jgi:hypothetical protein
MLARYFQEFKSAGCCRHGLSVEEAKDRRPVGRPKHRLMIILK